MHQENKGNRQMKYGSVCSGIEAASMAWHPLGWTPAFFSEIDKFPAAVLAHHYGSNMPDEPAAVNGVPNHGDMTEFERWPYDTIDILVGGTPCQDYSIAGLRAGMAGDRGSLTLTYIQIAARYRPTWVVWENVPGVLSSNKGRDFAKFLGDFSGTKINVPPDGWKTGGIVAGDPNAYGLAYRVIDTQFVRVDGFGRALPQRRRRVFVVGYLGDWRRAAAVLFEPESLQRNSAPRRKAGKAFTESADTGVAVGSLCARTGRAMSAQDAQQGHIIPARWPASVAPTLNAAFGDKMGLEDQHALGGAGLFVPVAFDRKGTQVQTETDGSHPTLRSMSNSKSHPNGGGHAAVAFDLRGREGCAVRRLTPIECERLQGFPDDFTRIPWRKKEADHCPDGPRYKALGNSMSVNAMRWIGRRIEMVGKL